MTLLPLYIRFYPALISMILGQLLSDLAFCLAKSADKL